MKEAEGGGRRRKEAGEKQTDPSEFSMCARRSRSMPITCTTLTCTCPPAGESRKMPDLERLSHWQNHTLILFTNHLKRTTTPERVRDRRATQYRGAEEGLVACRSEITMLVSLEKEGLPIQVQMRRQANPHDLDLCSARLSTCNRIRI